MICIQNVYSGLKVNCIEVKCAVISSEARNPLLLSGKTMIPRPWKDKMGFPLSLDGPFISQTRDVEWRSFFK